MNQTFFQTHAEQSSRILYTPGSFAKQQLLYLQESGTLTSYPAHTSKRASLKSFLFVLVLEGNGIFTYQNTTYSLHAGDCMLIDCTLPYLHQSLYSSWQLYWIHFYGTQAQKLYEYYLQLGGKNHFTAQKKAVYQNLLNEIYETAQTESPVHDLELHEKLSRLFVLLARETTLQRAKAGSQNSRKRNLAPILQYLEKHFPEKITLDLLSEHFYINKFYLTRIFKEEYHISINQYLIKLRISHAKQLLRFTTLPVEEVARQCGIRDVSYFNRLFHKTEGIAPGMYRKVWK